MKPSRLQRMARFFRIKRRRRRGRGSDQPPAVVNHDGLRAADPYAFEAVHRRLAWLLRLSVMINTGQFVVVIALVSTISTLVPLKTLEMGLVRIEPRDDRAVQVDPVSLVRILPITKETAGFDLLMESFVRRYVRILLEIDTVSQGDRMREANIHSDTDWWKKFTTEKVKEIDKALDSGLNRSVVVESAERISMRGGVAHYAVEFVQTDNRGGKVVEVKKVRAYLAVTTRPQTVRESEKFENPLGLRVLDVSLKERGNT